MFIEYDKKSHFHRKSLILSLPFNWKNPMGYLIVALFQYICVLNSTFFGVSVSTFVIGGSMGINSVIKDLKNIIKSFKYTKPKKSSNERLAKLCEFIDLHASAKQFSNLSTYFHKSNIWFIHQLTNSTINPSFRLVRDFSAVYRPVFIYMIVWSITGK